MTYTREQLKEILDSHIKWFRGKPGGKKADLRGADLRGTDLRGADLRRADFWGTDLRGADLRRVDLRGTDLRGADLRWADLRWANLQGADLRGVNLREVDLKGADLRGAILGMGRSLIDGGIDRRGYQFFAWVEPDFLIIHAGCRKWKNFEDALAHYGPGYDSNGSRSECLARLSLLEALVNKRLKGEG